VDFLNSAASPSSFVSDDSVLLFILDCNATTTLSFYSLSLSLSHSLLLYSASVTFQRRQQQQHRRLARLYIYILAPDVVDVFQQFVCDDSRWLIVDMVYLLSIEGWILIIFSDSLGFCASLATNVPLSLTYSIFCLSSVLSFSKCVCVCVAGCC
jgi:hypothetical protein